MGCSNVFANNIFIMKKKSLFKIFTCPFCSSPINKGEILIPPASSMLASQNFPKVQKFSYMDDPKAKTEYLRPSKDLAPSSKSSSNAHLKEIAWLGGLPLPVVEVSMKTSPLSETDIFYLYGQVNLRS